MQKTPRLFENANLDKQEPKLRPPPDSSFNDQRGNASFDTSSRPSARRSPATGCWEGKEIDEISKEDSHEEGDEIDEIHKEDSHGERQELTTKHVADSNN